MAKVTPVDPEGLWARNIWAHGTAAFIVRNCELIIYLFLAGGVFLSGFWAELFQVQILRIYPFPFNVKIYSHRCNPPQRSSYLWILIRNPQSHFSSRGGFPGWRGSLLLDSCVQTSLLWSAGLHAVGGRTNSDKSLTSQAESQCIFGNSEGLGRSEMRSGRRLGEWVPAVIRQFLLEPGFLLSLGS